jgi:hypothetical protein
MHAEPDLETMARRVMDGNRYMTVATIGEDVRPWATPARLLQSRWVPGDVLDLVAGSAASRSIALHPGEGWRSCVGEGDRLAHGGLSVMIVERTDGERLHAVEHARALCLAVKKERSTWWSH